MGRGYRMLLAVVLALLPVVAPSPAAPSEPADPPPVILGGPRGDPRPVHPPPGSPIADVSRDCGFSVELRDGRALWIFCDSSDAAFGVEPTWFINNSAAISLPGSHLVMREPLTGSGRPFAFILPGADDPCGSVPHIIWPTSAVVVPDGPVDRVLVYFENLCRVGGDDIFGVESRSMGVAEYRYDPAVGALSAPIRATILEPNLWPSPAKFGHASVVQGSYVYVYQCEFTWGDPWGCRLGRVLHHQVADRTAYRYWTGSGWSPSQAAAVFMAIPGTDLPGSAYQVAYIAEWGAFAMTYIAWPGIGATQKLRVAAQPWGPWSEAVSISLPACGPPHRCYSGTIHTQLTSGRSVGLAYFDPHVVFPDRPAAGQVRAYQQPVFPPFADRWQFWDVPPEHPFFADVEWVGAEGIARGYADTWFHPTDAVSRQAMAAFLHRLAGSPPVPPGAPAFVDVPDGHPFATEIRWSAAAGVAAGYPGGTFRPTATVSRQAMAAFLHRLAGSPPVPPGAPAFVDVPDGHPFATEIRWLAAAGVAAGYPGGTFGPAATVSRQAMAAFLHRYAACCPVAG